MAASFAPCSKRDNHPMGLFHVTARLTGPSATEELDLLVDTGATLLTIPHVVADRIGLQASREQSVVLAGGHRETWPAAEVQLALDGQAITTPCFIAPD